MAHQFQKHYSLAEARALLPQIRQWLKRLAQLQATLEKTEQRLRSLMAPGRDLGGEVVNRWVRTMTDLDRVGKEFQQREIQVKDVARGLVDFPAIIGDREVFLCWEQDEEDIEFWHELDAGYAGRERL